MKILALHGMGTSGHIFKSQTGQSLSPHRRRGCVVCALTHQTSAGFRARLPDTIEFDFVDAPFPCAPAPGTDVIFDSSHYAWWLTPTPDAIRGAHQWLAEYVEQHGPYDAVMAFSQGCSLVGSFLLYHARETPDLPLPFKAAVFVCGGLPLGVLEDLGVAVPPRAHQISEATSKMLKQKAGALKTLAANLALIRPGVGLWDETAGLLHDPDKMPDQRDVFGLDFTAMPEDLRIKMPTVHIYGAKDPRWPASMQLAYFCDKRQMYDHGGGHAIPRSAKVSDKMAELVVQLCSETDK